MVSIQTDSYLAQLTDETSQQLRGRLLAAGLESLSDRFADVEVGAIIRLDQADKQPLLDVVTDPSLPPDSGVHACTLLL